MGGSVIMKSRRKHWSKSPQSPAAGGARGVGGLSCQTSAARGKSARDRSLQ